ncbi:DMT family transporter [Zavarzinia sp. CC-PAN008]|uniref:DMT family transporter n=1 Tax=Zavarzinia sp. CC-PAN008 TaxID=3243332 RepID=UPI003F7484A3
MSAIPFSRSRSPELVGIGLMVVAIATFAAMDAIVKWLSADYPVAELVFFRALGTIGVALFLLRGSGGGLAALRTRKLSLHLVRSLCGLASLSLFFLSYRLLPFADVYAISFAGPLILTALSAPLLGEKVDRLRWMAVLLGLPGVLLIVRPGLGMVDQAALLVVVATVFFAIVRIMIRLLSRTDPAPVIVFYYALISLLVTGAMLPFLWVQPTPLDWVLLLGTGVIGGFAQIAMTLAFRYAPVATVGPFEYTGILWAVLIGYLVWGTMPDAWSWAGTAILIASGLIIVRQEASAGRDRAAAEARLGVDQ